MRKIFSCLGLAVCLLAWMAPGGARAEADSSAAPRKVWRVAYVEGGPFADYQRVFQGLALGLASRGMIEHGNVPIPSDTESTHAMWDWLTANAGGQNLYFPPDGFYSANWDASRRAEIRREILERIRTKGDIDAILAFGTWAGQDFAAADLDVPVIVSSVTNAVEAGIIPSADDSGRDNLLAVIEPDRYRQQVTLFHDIFHFKRLGIVYEDTPSGRSSIALGDIEQTARELGFELVRCTDVFDVPDLDLASRRLLACHEKLVRDGADAVYLTYNIGMQADSIPQLLAPLATARIPTFSQAGSAEVQRGALLSIAQSNITDQGKFSGEALAAIIQGTAPRILSQKFESMVSLAVNLRMATLIGWNPSLEILAAVDEIYQQI